MLSALLQSFRRSPNPRSSARTDRTRPLRDQLEKLLAGASHDEAVARLEQLESLEPTRPRWPHKRGDLLHVLGRDEQAFMAYATAVRLYVEAGHIELARAMARTAVATIPEAARRVVQLDSVTQATFGSVGLHELLGVSVVF